MQTPSPEPLPRRPSQAGRNKRPWLLKRVEARKLGVGVGGSELVISMSRQLADSWQGLRSWVSTTYAALKRYHYTGIWGKVGLCF